MSRVVRALETELEDQAALEDRRVAEAPDEPRQEPIKDEELPATREVRAHPGGVAQPLFERRA